MAELAKSFRELRAYKLAREAAGKIFRMTQTFPKEERYSLTDQIRRSSRATKNLIPEAWARRRYPAAFTSKLTEALGEAMETQGWLDDSLDCGYMRPEQFEELNRDFQYIGGMLTRMIEGAESFCPPAIREAKRTGA